MNFITGKHLPRRTFLQGMGATMALPFLDAMVPAARAKGSVDVEAGATRLVCIEEVHGMAGCNVQHGAPKNLWAPAETGRNFTLVPDNPKVGVDRANWYEPGLNRTYLDMAAHYGTAILPTRVRKPRDKAEVEVAVLVVERWILARLRHRRFFSLAELNEAIAGLVTDLDARPMRRLGVSRRDLFLELDRPALKPLPPAAYEYAEWRLRRVSLDYHVDIDGHYYSVPYRLVRDQVEARLTARTVELFHKGERVAAHLRGIGRGRHTTVPEHMPSAHRRHAEWTVERIGRTAAGIGPSTAKLTALILESRPHPEQGYRACLGILRLARRYGVERLEAACGRGLDIGARSYGSIRSILEHGLDRQPRRPNPQGELALPDHPNLRGSRYYH